MKKMNTNFRPNPIALLLLTGLFLSSCASHELPEPARFIPPNGKYHSAVYGFHFEHASMLELDVSDHGYDGVGLKLLYPGSKAQVFALDVVAASSEASVKSTAISGTGETTMVAGLPAYVFEATGADGNVQKTLLKKDGWLYVFEGKSDTFKEVLQSFAFDDGTPMPPS
jgi:hypothetical protein